MKQYIDQSVYPDLDEPPQYLETDEQKADYVARICGAWDFDIFPEEQTFVLFRQWKDIFDRYPLPHSPAYHTFRYTFGWEEGARPKYPIQVHLTYKVLDEAEGRGPDPCEEFV